MRAVVANPTILVVYDRETVTRILNVPESLSALKIDAAKASQQDLIAAMKKGVGVSFDNVSLRSEEI